MGSYNGTNGESGETGPQGVQRTRLKGPHVQGQSRDWIRQRSPLANTPFVPEAYLFSGEEGTDGKLPLAYFTSTTCSWYWLVSDRGIFLRILDARTQPRRRKGSDGSLELSVIFGHDAQHECMCSAFCCNNFQTSGNCASTAPFAGW